MSDPWVALIDLPPERRRQLEAVLASCGVRCEARDWDCGEESAPAVLIASAAEYPRNHARSKWLESGGDGPEVVLLAPSAASAETLRMQLHYDVFNMVAETLCDEPSNMERLIQGLLAPEEMFDMRRYIPEPVVFEQFPVTTLAEKHQIADEVTDLVRPYVATKRQVRDIHLIIDELINNAFFHSFRNLEGDEKYSPRQFSALDETDNVVLEIAAAEGAIALAVEDNRGSLSPREVLKYILRQTSGEGVYDSHGRGFYLISNLVNHISICLKPGKRARIVSLAQAGPEHPVRTLGFFVASP